MKPEYVLGLLAIGACCWLAHELHQHNEIEEARLALEDKKVKQERLPRLVEAAGNATGAVLEGAGTRALVVGESPSGAAWRDRQNVIDRSQVKRSGTRLWTAKRRRSFASEINASNG